MLGENIKRARKAKGFSQEELAVRLNVVRQTVSKWENGLSVPDADVLPQMAELLDVPVSRLLGAEGIEETGPELSQQLARLNGELADYARRERLAQQVNKKRGAILLLSLLSLPAALAVQNETVSLVLFGGCVLAALAVFYRSLTLLTGAAASRAQLRAVRAVTIFNVILIGSLITATALYQNGVITLSDAQAKPLMASAVVVIMLFFGFVSPKLPFNRHTGFRLPWTVRDEDTWNVAHKLLGYLALPLVPPYLAACWIFGDTIEGVGLVSLCVLLLWIGIPGVLSLVFFWKKMRGKL